MKKVKSKSELDNKLKELKKAFEGPATINGSIGDLKKWFKDKFNEDIVQIGDKLIYDLNALFYMSPMIHKEFNDDPIQPITITYKRLDIIFFTYDKHPEWGEKYTMYDSDWSKWLYPKEIKQSILWKHKEYLREKDPNEYYLQVNLFDINSDLVNYIKDIDFSDYE